ncbi:MAG TPA: hypothetical protein VJ964_11740 [Balneolaceae bacterium]|nr:hypothetical protein [Balneolaceae bacterium]
MIQRVINHIKQTAEVPSFSSYEERLHPYIRSVFNTIPDSQEYEVEGNSLIFRIGDHPDRPTIALAAHLDKINHYGKDYPDSLPVEITDDYIEGAMDDCAGLGIALTIAELSAENDWPNLFFFFSEMEESKGLKEHPELLKNSGKGYKHGMGANRISDCCLKLALVPEEVITLDTTPLFKGCQGIALYSKHWLLNALKPTEELIQRTEGAVERFLRIDSRVKRDNNTNDYLHYGEKFNEQTDKNVVSVALEPAICPYHQKAERVFVDDIRRTIEILAAYLTDYS